MRGFYFENHNNLKIVSGTSHNLIGHIDLEAGSYMVWGKLSLGVNVASGFPPPPWPHAVGVATLALGGADDIAYFGVLPESAENNTTLNLMCAATITRGRRARLYIMNLYSLPIYCHNIKLMALQIDTLAETETGEDRQDAPEDKEDRMRKALLHVSVKDRSLIRDLIDD
ncbi:MAG TPA: hypothetical protein VJM50_18525 [Pyrinomonadaceae bacterium]|nr:hypothetical protein [Pyrinomonadaceae bacterium]